MCISILIDLQPSLRPKSCFAFSVLGLQEASSSTSVRQQDRISSWALQQPGKLLCSPPQGLPAQPEPTAHLKGLLCRTTSHPAPERCTDGYNHQRHCKAGIPLLKP